MRKHWVIINVLFVSALIILGNIAIFGQASNSKRISGDLSPSLAVDFRPFDFTDKYYAANGIDPSLLLNRRNGADGLSVIDFNGERNHNNVRILATQTAYGRNGEPLFWNLYGEFNKDAFAASPAGHSAFDLAYGFPIYIFPSTTQKFTDRQSPVIDTSDGYFEKNVLGLSVAMVVEFNDAVTRDDRAYLAEMGKRNGLSVDGTPIVRTTKEVGQLQRRNLVSVTTRGGIDGLQAPFIAGRVIEYPRHGGIAGDAFLLYITETDGKPLRSESFFVENFECTKNNNGC